MFPQNLSPTKFLHRPTKFKMLQMHRPCLRQHMNDERRKILKIVIAVIEVVNEIEVGIEIVIEREINVVDEHLVENDITIITHRPHHDIDHEVT